MRPLLSGAGPFVKRFEDLLAVGGVDFVGEPLMLDYKFAHFFYVANDSLPHRQLTNINGDDFVDTFSSLPHRQLRKFQLILLLI